MPRHDDYPGPLLSDQPERLFGIRKPRIASVPIAGMPERSDRKNEQSVILAKESTLHRFVVSGQFHDWLAEECGQHDNYWDWQKRFYSGDLLPRFFEENMDWPGWISITQRRFPACHQRDPKFRICQDVGRPKRKSDGPVFQRQSLGQEWWGVSCKRLKLTGMLENPAKEMRLVTQTISRRMLNRQFHAFHDIDEYWIYLMTRNVFDRKATKRGHIPALTHFFNESTNILSAPIVTLCKLDRLGTLLTILAFELDPESGETIDLRQSTVPFEYYLIGGTDNQAMLDWTLAAGG